ncbi:SUR7/PalI family-domain-containing protein [Lasiosphaeria miniovina]|uniref:SUR7/PalI family-domain-containing protein n=1 Tax=Lasiosphaeria miniovina TaxID=1954250 RepID=A0AA40B6L7_9PEZI|nr:SUR7/PalI family-domain-containing protein [Lasiosphaeria miniovina]KAK0728552.1 SUR7/PalI family-domain-containing protein [Lasiosphaeria miniovina]
MALPSILRIRRRNQTEKASSPAASAPPPPRPSTSKEEELQSPAPPLNPHVTKDDIRRATKLRRGFAISASVSYVLSFIFLMLVIIGNTFNKPVLRDIYFYTLDLTDIVPKSVPNASLINSIAQSIGLHDFYQVGLWNFCEGYQNEGITYCSPPQNLYWFNPVAVLMNELLAGATIALPTQVLTILDVLRITSQIMFGFFVTGAVLNFCLVFASPLAVRSRWWSLPLAGFAGLSTVFVVAAAIAVSVISFAFKYAVTAQQDLNIRAHVGVRMFVFMWLAAGFTIYSSLVHAAMGCCCASRRDIETGRRVLRSDGVIVQGG